MKPKARLRTHIRVRIYPVIAAAVETAIAYGLTRAYKHTETPTRDVIEENVTREVMNSLCELLDFDE